jgi:dienelactone hydrolase
MFTSDEVRAMEGVDGDKIALMGYCFGGTGALMYALTGVDNVQAIVSVHGGLGDFPVGPMVKPRMLVLSGGEDDTATAVRDLEMTLDTGEADWEITRYSGVEHAFTVFDGPAYNEWADLRSWFSASHFLQEVFLEIDFESFEPEEFNVTAVDYEDVDGTQLRGYLALPDEDKWIRPLPAVVVFPDWDGVNAYEKKRATMLADRGYVAFAADIYGSDLQEGLTMEQMIAGSTKYSSDVDLYVQRMQAGINQVMKADGVNTTEVAIIGYYFGGSGVVQYGFSGSGSAKVAVAFHGSFFQDRAPNVTGDIVPRTLM